ncbi:helix-turn-helix domain-containing protein [Streptomyces sp. NPDC088258]|uniref:helix-turn-helix domain-containing protein n=1 Tax=Streptomyces sp. NPDC088258 TaxID=3365849 RepID=UPI0038042EF4
MSTSKLLLHPVRLRIVQIIFGADEMTTAQLRDRLPDVSPATVYRHIAALTRAGVLEVVSERPVRGTVERGYRVRQDRALVDADARAAMTKDDHLRAFTVFTGGLMADFDRYVSRADAEPAQEGVLYRQGAVWLTDDEFRELADEIETAITRRTRHTPDDGRTRHIVSFVTMPDKPVDGERGEGGEAGAGAGGS